MPHSNRVPPEETARPHTPASLRLALCCGTIALLLGLPAGVSAQAEGDRPPAPNPATTPAAPAGMPVPQPATPPSEAERIARLRKAIDDARQQMSDLQVELTRPDSEYEQAHAEFQKIDTEYNSGMRELKKLRDLGKTAEADALEQDLQVLEKPRQLAKDRFQLAIDVRKALQQKITALETKIAQDQMALDSLLGVTPPAVPAPKPPAGSGTPEAPAPMPGVSPNPFAVMPPAEAPAGAKENAAGSNGNGSGEKSLFKPPSSEELASARVAAEKKVGAAQEAEQEAANVEARIELLRQDLELERQLRDKARRKSDNAAETERELGLKLQRRMAEGAPQTELDEHWKKITETKLRYRDGLTEMREHSDRMEEIQEQINAVQSERLQVLQHAAQMRDEAEQAQNAVKELENPFTFKNLMAWAMDHGPKILLIIFGMYVMGWFARLFGRRILLVLVAGNTHGSPLEREARANTLAAVFQNAASVAITLGGILMIFEEAGIDVTVLMGGVAVLGLAVAFGAQNLIKDYFTGFMILLENQYTLNDVVQIGSVSGQVELVTLRMTALRDIEGRIHFIPNGQINSVTNMTHGWSRAVLDIGIAKKENVDRAMQVLVEIGTDIRKDPMFSSMILEDPTMLGVDEIRDSAIIIRFYIKTRPLMQWTVKREMLRRIKNRFDELHIEMPLPQRTLYHRVEENGQLPVLHELLENNQQRA